MDFFNECPLELGEITDTGIPAIFGEVSAESFNLF